MNGWGNKMISAVEVGSHFHITDWILSFLLNCFFLLSWHKVHRPYVVIFNIIGMAYVINKRECKSPIWPPITSASQLCFRNQNDNICDLQLVSSWDNSWSDAAVTSLCGVEVPTTRPHTLSLKLEVSEGWSVWYWSSCGHRLLQRWLQSALVFLRQHLLLWWNRYQLMYTDII